MTDFQLLELQYLPWWMVVYILRKLTVSEGNNFKFYQCDLNMVTELLDLQCTGTGFRTRWPIIWSYTRSPGGIKGMSVPRTSDRTCVMVKVLT